MIKAERCAEYQDSRRSSRVKIRATMSGEIVTIFVGQAGTQVSHACWELFCLEHGVGPDGIIWQNYRSADHLNRAFFVGPLTTKLTPRTLILDSEPMVIDEIRTGPYRGLFDPSSLVTGKEDAANNFARGYYTIGQEIVYLALDRIRKIVEGCSRLSGFMVFRSCGGGTGSGCATLIFQHLADDYSKNMKLDFSNYPAPNLSTSIVEPYNAVLTTHATLDNADCCFLIDNEALYEICARNLDLDSPTYTNLNRLQAQTVSSITAPIRFGGGSNLSLEELQTNLVPYPRIHFPLITYAPIITPNKAIHSEMTVRQITYECFEPGNQMAKCDPRTGAYMSCCLLYRGDVNLNDINRAITSLKEKKSIRFVDWSPSGFKVGVTYQPTTTVPGGDLARTKQTVTMLSNNTSIKRIWQNFGRKFDLMYRKKAFLHHYVGEGMEESIFQDARDNVAALIEDYKESRSTVYEKVSNIKMLIGGAVSYVAGKQAVRTVYWRTANNGRLLKTAKTCMFQGPPKPAPSSTSTTASIFDGRSHMDLVPRVILNSKN
ncbi:hypothetical protein KM043_006681 [Ampulex compressa]|nr:hypothetical protein KM043_006681 [Ampulex compressa]